MTRIRSLIRSSRRRRTASPSVSPSASSSPHRAIHRVTTSRSSMRRLGIFSPQDILDHAIDADCTCCCEMCFSIDDRLISVSDMSSDDEEEGRYALRHREIAVFENIRHIIGGIHDSLGLDSAHDIIYELIDLLHRCCHDYLTSNASRTFCFWLAVLPSQAFVRRLSAVLDA